MEGMTPTLVLSAFASLILGSVSLILFAVTIGFYLSNRPVLKLFATAVFCALTSAGFMGLAAASEGKEWSMLHVYALCLFLSAIGQLIAAFRRNYPTALECAAASSAFAIGPLTTLYHQTNLRLVLFNVPCVLLAVASLVVALRPAPSRKLTTLKLVLINLVLFVLALMFFATENYGIHMELDGGITLKNQFVDLWENTHWRWVLAATVASILTSTRLFKYRPTLTRRRFLIASAVITVLASQWATGYYGALALRREIILGAGSYVVQDFIPYAIVPGLIRCNYTKGKFDPKNPKAVDPNPQFFKDDYLWYGFGHVRLRHVQLPSPEAKPFRGLPGFRLEFPKPKSETD